MPELTERQRAILVRLQAGEDVRDIAKELGVTRNAVYQQIQRMRRHGVLPSSYTPTGQPPRELPTAPGAAVLARLVHDDDGDGSGFENIAAAALVEEVRRTRDELDHISQRLSRIVPR